jgi:hypothetical protein
MPHTTDSFNTFKGFVVDVRAMVVSLPSTVPVIVVSVNQEPRS